MDPNQQLPVPQPGIPGGNANDPYDFLHQKTQKRTMFSGGSKQKFLIIGVIAGVIVTFLVALFMLVFGGGSGYEGLVSLNARQKEIVRVADIGTTNARSNNSRALAQSTKLAMTTSDQDTAKYLSGLKRKATPSELAEFKSSKTTTALTNAKTAGRFDDEFVPTLRKQLTDYQAAIEAENKIATLNSEKELLKKLYEQATILLKHQ